ncbi:glycoside hydrolase family 2 protein [Dactylosporangium sp. CA-052675]|uniref:glycoside hydrolase family 2 protein n=1 Tax=Dactylosporangium sp. CA-052675 TaxID=3239927 RepID=UPI003D9076D1
MPAVRPLHSGWTVRVAGDDPDGVAPTGPLPASVPGCVHTDLLAAGLIPDPYLDDNERRLAWIGRTPWLYETTFDAGPVDADRVQLVAEGLDTIASVTFNGVELGRTANMHREYRFDVTDHVRATGNQLSIRFDSAYAYAEAVRDQVGARPNAYDEPFQYIRKMACNFGWDWGPTLVTAGVWRPIGLHMWSMARLARVRPLVTVDGGTGRVEVRADLERARTGALRLRVAVAGQTMTVDVPADATQATAVLEVPDVTLWWPRGLGDAHRYELAVTLEDPAGATTLDGWRGRIGFRTVELDTTPDADGSRFALRVNGTPIFVRGVNWIPDDAFVTRVTRERYAERLEQACAAGVNYLRVWGGGRYESDDFYDLADELGLMVGQDFLFACAAYPEEEPLRSEVAAEAREQVVRLMTHPSLVMWVGNNENIWGFHDWGWREALDGRSWGEGYYLDVLPGIVAELDPGRPYWPGSPWSGNSSLHPNDPDHGTTHIWDVWNTHDYRHYRGYRPRFVAEFGFQAPPAFATLRRAVSDDPLTPTSPGIAHHQKAIDGNAKLARGLEGHFPAPATFDDWHWATQLNQARAISFGVEHFRSLRPLCMGTIVWQLNDNWPVTSWSAVDGDGRRKPLWYALRRSYAQRLLTLQPRDGRLALVAVNDSSTPWIAEIEVRRVTFAGDPRAKATIPLEVPAGGALTVPLSTELSTADEPAAELIVADSSTDTDTERALWCFAEDVDLRYPPAVTDVAVRRGETGLVIEVTAGTLLRDLTLFADRLDPAATVDRQLVTLLPGESATFRVRGGRSLEALAESPAWAASPVLRCANDLMR